MHPFLAAFLDGRHGLVRSGPLPGLPRWALSNAVREGDLVRFLPGVYGTAADPVRAAALYVDGRGGISHATALSIWGLCPRSEPIHLTVLPRCRLRAPGLRVHIRDSLTAGPPTSSGATTCR